MHIADQFTTAKQNSESGKMTMTNSICLHVGRNQKSMGGSAKKDDP